MPGLVSATTIQAVPSGVSSPLGAGFNLVNTLIGSGILALPYALKEAGFYPGIVVMVLVAALIHCALNTLVLAGRRTGLYKYESVSEAALGRIGYHILGFALSVNSIGSCISYLIIIGDTASSVAQTLFGINVLTSRQVVILAASLVFTLPLLFFRTLDPLVKPSAISTLCLPVIVLIVAIRGPAYAAPEDPSGTPAAPAWWGPSFLPAFGVIAFAYSCTQTCFQSYTTLRVKTMDAWRISTTFATATAVVIYLTFSIISYRSFGVLTEPNVLNNFGPDDNLANVARALLAFSLTLTYPMQFYPIRDLLAHSLLGLSPADDDNEEEEENSGSSLLSGPLQKVKFRVFTIALFASTLVTALVIEDLGFVFKLIGTAASSLIVFVLPGVIYLVLVSPYSLWPPWSTKNAGINSNSNDNENGGDGPTLEQNAVSSDATIIVAAEESTPLLSSSSSLTIDPTDPLNDAREIHEPLLSAVSVLLLAIGCAVFVIGTWDSVADYLQRR
ncbi:hypothetical protein GGI11_000030 [Coemansia sp. RSA 2049]|nr:hypothetical protein H4217_000975 [Coemansia sp. RSA 1939]KAJ2525458.1 hypothetical protein GGI11_000030 [Coemansia sp. RSA 2049]KAJ2607656.1 hypothetical protein EV177_005403 [Coemansia sp. RSA 1804]KAJ2684842.1 hypothetical protein GGH99_003919 [Coemansia sp. RSA 1285]